MNSTADMSQSNRARITVDLDADWRKFGYHVPDYCRPIGTAELGDVSGILVHQLDGLYCLIHADGLTKLDQRKIKSALGIKNGAGAPRKLDKTARGIEVRLEERVIANARQIGGGSVSEGIRIACEFYAAANPASPP